MTALEKVNEYARQVRSGGLLACEMVRKAVERWDADWERSDLYFDAAAFNLDSIQFVNVFHALDLLQYD